MSLRVEDPGFFTTVQDAGRPGYRSMGIPEAGAADRSSFHHANRILSNPEYAAVLECTLKGGEYQFQKDASIALTGADMRPEVNGVPVTMFKKIYLRKGDVLRLSTAVSGYRTYLAVYGGFCCENVLGSASTYIPAVMGGHEGRALKKGDVLRWYHMQQRSAEPFRKSEETDILQPALTTGKEVKLPVRPGPEWDLISDDDKRTFLDQNWEVTGRSDRMAIHLRSDVTLGNPNGIVSSPVIPGVVQLPGSGSPVILFRDAQTIGGYPRIAICDEESLDVLAQCRPGALLQFRIIH